MLKYNLHDSLIERIDYESKIKKLDITIDLCNWLQVDYVEGEPENSIIHMIFNNVTHFDTNFMNYNFESNEILEVIEIDRNTLKLVFMGNNDVETIVISASEIMFSI